MTARMALRRRFEKYRPEIEALGARIPQAAACDALDTIEGYIDSGSDSDVFRLPSDPSLVVKLPYADVNRGLTPAQVTRRYVNGLIRGIGERGLEQIVAFNDSRRRRPFAVINRYVEGPTLRAMSHEERYAIPSQHYVGLLVLFSTMQEKKLGIELGVSANIKYNTGGFTIIDYHYDLRQTLEEKVIDFAANDMLLEQAPYKGRVPSYGLLYRDVCHERLGGNVAAAIENMWRQQEFVVYG